LRKNFIWPQGVVSDEPEKRAIGDLLPKNPAKGQMQNEHWQPKTGTEGPVLFPAHVHNIAS
jgi:hypothetical protein